MFSKNFNFQFRIFIFFTIILLLEGFYHYYSYRLSYLCLDDLSWHLNCISKNPFSRLKHGFNPIIWNENRTVEILQSVFLIICIYQFLKILLHKNKFNFQKYFIFLLYIYFIGILYFTLEENSWGQHIIKWNTSEFFLKYNNQGETNIHNISNIFNELPRTLLIIWCGLSFLLIKLIPKPTNKYEDFYKFIYPSKKLKYISFLLLLFVLPNLIVDKLNLHPGHSEYGVSIGLSEIYDFFTFNFIKLSEFQELLLTYYMLNHTFFFKLYLNNQKLNKK